MARPGASARAVDRELIFTNLLNGVSAPEVARAFHKDSEREVMEDFKFVALKIKSDVFARAMPYIPCDTVAEAMGNRIVIFGILNKINLDTVPIYSSIKISKVEEVYG